MDDISENQSSVSEAILKELRELKADFGSKLDNLKLEIVQSVSLQINEVKLEFNEKLKSIETRVKDMEMKLEQNNTLLYWR